MIVAREEILIDIRSSLQDSDVQEMHDRLSKLSDKLSGADGVAGQLAESFEDLNTKMNSEGRIIDADSGQFVGDETKSRIRSLAEQMDNALGSVQSFTKENANLAQKLDGVGGVSANIREKMSDYKDQLHGVTGENRLLGKASQQMGQDMKSTFETLRKAGKSLVETEEGVVKVRDDLTGQTTDLAGGLKQAKSEAQDFQGELLSSMFFAMQLERSLGSMMQESFQVAGVYDLISNILKFLFLPIAMQVQQALIDVANYVMSLSSDTRSLIGRISFAAFLFSKFARILSVTMLGIRGFAEALLKIPKIASASAKAMSYLGSAITWLKGTKFAQTIASWTSALMSFNVAAYLNPIGAWAAFIGVVVVGLIEMLAQLEYLKPVLSTIYNIFWGIGQLVEGIVDSIAWLLGKSAAVEDIGESTGLSDFSTEGLLSGVMSGLGMDTGAGAVSRVRSDLQRGSTMIQNNFQISGGSGLDEQKVGSEVETRLANRFRGGRGTRFG